MASETRLRRLWSVLVGIFWAAANVRAFEESDVYWHLSLGREIVRHHTRTFPETMSFIAAGRTSRSQEWLWDVGTYLLHARWGFGAITALIIVLAAAAGIAVTEAAWSFRARDPAEQLGALFLTTALVSPPALARVRERPETAAILLLPLVMLAAHRLAGARTRSALVRSAIAVFALELLWVQLHPSFVLGAIATVILAGPELVLGSTDARKTGALLGVGFLVAFATNIPALAVMGSHTGGYAVANITDMQPPTFASLNPTQSPLMSAYAAIFFFALIAMALARRVFWRPLALAAVGLVITLRIWRGSGPGALLAIPLAMESFGELLRRVRAESTTRAATVGLIGAGFIFVRTLQFFDTTEGGLGFTGVDPAAFPSASSRVIASGPAGARILTSYGAGGPLGWWLDGHATTFVDSRTPLLFDDVDYATARVVWARPDTLKLATERWDLDGAVVERDMGLCKQLEGSPDWFVAMVEPNFSLFIRKKGRLDAGIRALETLEACAGSQNGFLRAKSCEDLAKLDGDVGAVMGAGDGSFARYLQASSVTKCSKDSFDADAVVALLEPRAAAIGFLPERDSLLAWVYAKAGREDEVAALAKPYLSGPWGPNDIDAMLPALHVLKPTASARSLFETAYNAWTELAPPWLEAKLATACMLQSDEPCTNLHAFRAAALGELEAGPPLCWLAKRGRADANAWLELLRKRANDASSRSYTTCHD